jgi:hypothetical protein
VDSRIRTINVIILTCFLIPYNFLNPLLHKGKNPSITRESNPTRSSVPPRQSNNKPANFLLIHKRKPAQNHEAHGKISYCVRRPFNPLPPIYQVVKSFSGFCSEILNILGQQISQYEANSVFLVPKFDNSKL